jgi:hypothetical protein
VREEAGLHVPRRHGAGLSGLRLGSERRRGTRETGDAAAAALADAGRWKKG